MDSSTPPTGNVTEVRPVPCAGFQTSSGAGRLPSAPRCAIVGQNKFGTTRGDGDDDARLPHGDRHRVQQAVVAANLPGPDAGVPGAVRAGRGGAVQAGDHRVLRQSGAERADRRGALDRHPAVVPAGDPAVARSGLGQQFPHRRSRAGAGAAAETAGADGGDPRRRALRPDDDLAADHAASAWIRSPRGSTRPATSRAT